MTEVLKYNGNTQQMYNEGDVPDVWNIDESQIQTNNTNSVEYKIGK
jgi:hypothetical protein